MVCCLRLLYTIAPSNDSTLAVEISKTGLRKKKKHLLFFEKFEGDLLYAANHPETSRAAITIDSRNLLCRDKWLSAKEQDALCRYTTTDILAADRYPEIRFTSASINARPLRGFTVEGPLQFRGMSRSAKVNIVITEMKPGLLQIDGDATLRFSDFGIVPPSSLLGLIGTKDEVLVRILLWAHAAGVEEGHARAGA